MKRGNSILRQPLCSEWEQSFGQTSALTPLYQRHDCALVKALVIEFEVSLPHGIPLLRKQDSNLRPSGYEPDKLPTALFRYNIYGESNRHSMKRILLYQLSYKTEVLARLELATHICLYAKYHTATAFRLIDLSF